MSLFKKFFSSKKQEDSSNEEKGMSNDFFLQDDESAIDENFVVNFTKSGGKFLYCESLQEIFESFNNILEENDWHNSNICCYEDQLIEKFKTFNLNFSNNTNAEFFFASCEFLVSNIGGILLTNHQLKDSKTTELPSNIVIFAKASQIIKDLDVGMQALKNNSKTIPTNITTLRQFGNGSDDNFLNYGSTPKNLYLLLLEDL